MKRREFYHRPWRRGGGVQRCSRLLLGRSERAGLFRSVTWLATPRTRCLKRLEAFRAELRGLGLQEWTGFRHRVPRGGWQLR